MLSGGYGSCDSCYNSDTCSALFGGDTGMYWTASEGDTAGYAWFVELDSWQGAFFNESPVDEAGSFTVRCVRSE